MAQYGVSFEKAGPQGYCDYLQNQLKAYRSAIPGSSRSFGFAVMRKGGPYTTAIDSETAGMAITSTCDDLLVATRKLAQALRGAC